MAELIDGEIVQVDLKPITYVTTYRGVSGFRKGLHEGQNRDVVIAGSEIPGPESFHGYATVPVELAEQGYEEAHRVMQDFTARIDKMFVYLGARGTGPGFEYISKVMDENNGGHICMVACDCGAWGKENFARSKGLGLVWAECGGEGTLGRIVRDSLR